MYEVQTYDVYNIANISILKNGRAKAVRFETLEAICKALDCQPGDILEYNRA
ncbi:MAG TPA: helix-turn-helix domain-containing protein [Candidatus Paceibacterota bacterium]